MADSVRPVGPITDVECSPATTCAFVTTTPGAAIQPLPSWISSQARPATFTVDARTRVLTAGVIDVPGGGPGFGGVCSVPRAEGYGASEIARPHAAKRDGCVGPQRSIAATIDEPRAIRAGQPFAVANDGTNIQSRTTTPTAPPRLSLKRKMRRRIPLPRIVRPGARRRRAVGSNGFHRFASV